jgi:hypothetical protein
MAVLKKLIAIGLIGLSVVMALHFILSPFYPDLSKSLDAGEIWDILNWFMAAGVIALLVVHYLRKRALDEQGADGSVTREYLEANLALYGSILLALWFFWNWFDNLAVGAGVQSNTNLIYWALIDPLLIIAYGVTGCCLWRSASRD